MSIIFLYYLLSQFLEGVESGFRVDGFVLVRTENLGEEVRDETTETQVGVGDRQRAAFSVTGRARMRSGGFRTHNEQSVAEEEHRTSARSHRVHIQLIILNDMFHTISFQSKLQMTV